MNISKLKIIIAREYLNKVKKKSFLIITFLAPVLFAGVCLLPSLIMAGAKEETKKVGVVDYAGFIADSLHNRSTVTYMPLGDADLGINEELKPDGDKLTGLLNQTGADAIVAILPIDTLGRSFIATAYSRKDLGMETTALIKDDINGAIENYRIANYQRETGLNLEEAMDSVRSDVNLVAMKVNDDGSVAVSESAVLSILSMVLGMALYMFIMMFCGMVMSSVIEEKSSRVVEVLISSVKATELMFGKIIGVALVAMTQFLLWILLTAGIIAVLGSILGFDTLFGMASADPTGMTDMSGIAVIFSTLGTLNYGSLLTCFILFFVFGYLLYASLYAAIGSAVETEADTQQLQLPLTIPLMIGFFISIYTMKAPDSGVVFWGSMIPFTSPIVMLSRIPFDPPVWQIVLSLAILVGTFLLMAWCSAKIYKVGVLMFGKKSTFKDLWKWFRQDN